MKKKKLSRLITVILCLCFWIPSFAETVVLKSGKTLTGNVIEKTDQYVKLDINGTSQTCYFDEIESIDGNKISLPSLTETAGKTTQFSLPKNIILVKKADLSKQVFSRGVAYTQVEKNDEAIAQFTNAIDLEPRYVEAYLSRALAYFAKKEYENAWNDVHKAEALGGKVDPKFLEGLRKASGREK